MNTMKMSTRDRWLSMLAVAVAGILLTSDIACRDAVVDDAGKVAAACEPDAKPANLDLTLKDMNGADVKFASFKGKVILLNFWATWCAPCKAEIPGFVALQKQYEKDLQVLGVSVDDSPKDVKPYAAEYKMNYPVLIGLNREDVDKAYGPFLGIPQTFIISRGGKICRRHAGIATRERFEQEIKALL